MDNDNALSKRAMKEAKLLKEVHKLKMRADKKSKTVKMLERKFYFRAVNHIAREALKTKAKKLAFLQYISAFENPSRIPAAEEKIPAMLTEVSDEAGNEQSSQLACSDAARHKLVIMIAASVFALACIVTLILYSKGN